MWASPADARGPLPERLCRRARTSRQGDLLAAPSYLRGPSRDARAMPDLDKKELWEALKARLESELAKAQKRARDAAEGATHEENRAEGDKDMRATEASYVARGQAGRASEMQEALVRVGTLELLTFE